MSSCISTSKTSYNKIKLWLLSVLCSVVIVIGIIFGFNYIIDPYNMTKYNILNIKVKFARDDRVEKVAHFKTLDRYFDNILIGSSRVYTIDPRYVSQKLGGETYNFGVGTASVEDHLGILLFLQRQNKLPKNLIIGVDFYTFNPDVPTNQYFLKNIDLNFLSYGSSEESDYWNKFLTFDALRASWKTFKNHIKKSNEVSTFDSLGWSPRFFNLKFRDKEKEQLLVIKEINDSQKNFYSDFNYSSIDNKRVMYYERIKQICKDYKINLYVFMTPLHPMLLNKLQSHDTKYAINQLNNYLSTFDNFHNFFYDINFNTNLDYFHGATHTNSDAGYNIIDTILINK